MQSNIIYFQQQDLFNLSELIAQAYALLGLKMPTDAL